MAGDVGEGQASVVRQRGEAEELGGEEEEGAEQHDGRVGPQLLTLPQVLLLHARLEQLWEMDGWMN